MAGNSDSQALRKPMQKLAMSTETDTLPAGVNTLAVAESCKAKGMLSVKSGKTGSTKVQFPSKRDFMKSWIAEDHRNADGSQQSKKTGEKLFKATRLATLQDASKKVGQAFMEGKLLLERLTGDKLGDLRSISLMRPKRADAEKTEQLIRTAARAMHVDEDKAVAMAKEESPELFGLPARSPAIIDVGGTVTAEKTEPAAAAPASNQGVAVAAAA